ncbi:MAG TPA: tRNA pseudouridine(38-40) synthase TruA, partial [Anaerolineales bacterium]
PSMEHYQVILAYDGSRYKGFQRQADARTVQGVVEDALRKLNWHGRSILAAGRTDTGAHATGQVIAFQLEWDHDTQRLQQALNNHLPSDVVAREVRQVPASFHPRYDACWRRYVYRIYCQPVRDPLLEPYAWRVWPTADMDVLQEAAHSVIGRHDFCAFGTPPQGGSNTVRCVLASEWKLEANSLIYEVTAQTFLYHMVRRLVFMQVKIAQGELQLADLLNALRDRNGDLDTDVTDIKTPRRLVHGLAPARGLVLAEVGYQGETTG